VYTEKEKSFCYPDNVIFVCRHIQKIAKVTISFIMSAQVSGHSSASNKSTCGDTSYGHQDAVMTYLAYCKEHKLNLNWPLKAI